MHTRLAMHGYYQTALWLGGCHTVAEGAGALGALCLRAQRQRTGVRWCPLGPEGHCAWGSGLARAHCFRGPAQH